MQRTFDRYPARPATSDEVRRIYVAFGEFWPRRLVLEICGSGWGLRASGGLSEPLGEGSRSLGEGDLGASGGGLGAGGLGDSGGGLGAMLAPMP